jgi:lysophospholipase L1-like esterase
MPYKEVLDDVYREIWRIRDGDPVVLRAVEFINPAISAWREAGIEEECTEALEAMNDTIGDAAVEGGATLVSTYDLFNGSNHDEDPREKGWIGVDGIHLSDQGKQAVAEALLASGLTPNQAP